MSAEEKLQAALDQARQAGLRYVHDSDPGILRKRKGKLFSYVDAAGKTVDARTVQRCKKLAIPPAWEHVWICAHPNGHVQATGIDSRGRRQYRYHADWRTARDQTKFENMVALGKGLPAIRRRVNEALNAEGLPRTKVIAAIVRLLDKTGLRVGNDAYTDENKTFGITTIRKKHLDLHGKVIELDFPGKGGKVWQGSLTDAKVAKVLAECGDLPGTRLFKYVDDNGDLHAVGSHDVNAWLQETSGLSITAKDFRTWTACTLFVEEALRQSHADTGFHLKPILKAVSSQLGNTPAILQKSYVHPNLVDLYRTGCFMEDQWQDHSFEFPAGLKKPEALLMRWLEAHYA